MFFDAITSYNPRLVIYDGLNSAAQLGGAGIVDSTLIISQFGKLGNVNNTNLGGYLTDTGLVNGTPYVGVYTKSLFADISGTSKLLIKQDNDNLISFLAGTLTLKATAFTLTSTNLGIYSGANAMILLGHSSTYASAKIGLKNDGSGKLASNNINWDASGNTNFGSNITIAGTLTFGASGVIKILNAGAGANGFILDAAGIRGYDTVLGMTFNLPTNGGAPEFSSGIIKYTTFEVNTNAVIRTSATVGDGSSNAAGILMNNTGFYACGVGQLLADAAVKILTNGDAYFTGSITSTSGTIGGWVLTSSSLTSTSIGFHSGASAMILLGHATVYASAKIGFLNDGSGKVASGNLSWDAAGVITASGNWTNTATITGGTIQTASGTGQKIVINESGYSNTIRFYDSSNQAITLYASAGALQIDKTFLVTNGTSSQIGLSYGNGFTATKSTDGGFNWTTIFQTSNTGVIYGTGLNIGTDGTGNNAKFIVDSSGRILTVNNTSASGNTGKYLRSDGTSFTAAAIAVADLPASAFGTPDTASGRYVATSSGGSPTTQLRKLALTLGATAYNILLAD
jgi:hypothetical protein